MSKHHSTLTTNLPEQETDLIARIKLRGPQLIDGREWYLDEQNHLHYRTYPELDGDQLKLFLQEIHPKDSLFYQSERRQS